MKTKKRLNYSIEFLRFLFAVMIVYYHILYANIMDMVPAESLYWLLKDKAQNAGYIVECFFLLSGYFLYVTWKSFDCGFYRQTLCPSVAGAGI
jgi:Acyltransferase family.